MATRTCVECGEDYYRDSFSHRQWRKGDGRARCISCVTASEELDEFAIRDDDCEAVFEDEDLLEPFDEGGFRWAALGHYTEGERTGEACVAKWLKDEIPDSVASYHGDLKCVRRTLDFVREFNALDIAPVPIRVHVPTVHTFEDDSALGAVVYLREPFIEGYDKWNSNSGWYTDDSEWAQVMQALSHYSYHASEGRHLLCDLQGGLFEDECILSDPAILSHSMSYGSTDMGSDGIASFFYEHECNEYCSHEWIVPNEVYPYYDSELTTTTMWDTINGVSRRTVHRNLHYEDTEESDDSEDADDGNQEDDNEDEQELEHEDADADEVEDANDEEDASTEYYYDHESHQQVVSSDHVEGALEYESDATSHWDSSSSDVIITVNTLSRSSHSSHSSR